MSRQREAHGFEVLAVVAEDPLGHGYRVHDVRSGEVLARRETVDGAAAVAFFLNCCARDGKVPAAPDTLMHEFEAWRASVQSDEVRVIEPLSALSVGELQAMIPDALDCGGAGEI